VPNWQRGATGEPSKQMNGNSQRDIHVLNVHTFVKGRDRNVATSQ
jgi:hypothetical protein